MIRRDRVSLLARAAAVFGVGPLARVAGQWREAANRYPMILPDIITLGGIEEDQGDSLDPQQLAFNAGRRTLALHLLARIGASEDDLNAAQEILDDATEPRNHRAGNADTGDGNAADFLNRNRDGYGED